MHLILVHGIYYFAVAAKYTAESSGLHPSKGQTCAGFALFWFGNVIFFKAWNRYKSQRYVSSRISPLYRMHEFGVFWRHAWSLRGVRNFTPNWQ